MPWDYIIVGAGSAGAPLAARLSEDPATRVLLIEAGADYRAAETPPQLLSQNPFQILLTADDSLRQTYLWTGIVSRRTEAQPQRPLKRGRGVGGSSAINGLTAIRGEPEAFDAWAESGCAGWSAMDVLPYFQRLEDDTAFGDAPYHARGGPIPVHRTPVAAWGAVDVALRDAALGLGFPWMDDLHAPGATGVGAYPINSRNGVRVSTNHAYLEPARGRPNLHIMGQSLVERVVFEGARAIGVVVRDAGGTSIHTGREIIVSCGAVHSPALLMRSGLGPAPQLQALGIPIVANIPGVGGNLWDHPVVRIEFQLKPEARANDPDARHTSCCLRTDSGLGGRHDTLFFAINHGGFNEQALKSHGDGGFFVGLFESYSRGRLHLRSSDPEDDPMLEHRMLSDDRDLQRMRDAARLLFKLGGQPAAAKIAERITIGTTAIPLEAFAESPDRVIDEWLLADANDCSHVAGTCRMGAFEDDRCVVDPECRVRGIDGLRVADASIMPHDCRANLHLTTVMIGERLAGLLRGA